MTVKVGDKEYTLEEKDEALILAIQELTQAINMRRVKNG